MEKKVLAVVVVYHPQASLLKRNIDAFKDDVDKIIIWQNSSVDHSLFESIDYTDKIIFVNKGTNVGISRALNYAFEYALNNGYDYLLTMDQDSVWVDFGSFKEFVVSKNKHEVCIIGPTIIYDFGDIEKIDRTNCILDEWVITSGMLIQTSMIKKLRGYNEYFSVDGIDIDFCLRAKENGINSYQTSAGALVQQFGTTIRKYGLNIRFYNDKRLESIIKNHIILFKKYKSKGILREFVEALKNGFLSILFLTNKKKLFRAICRGIYLGINSNGNK